MNSLEIVWYILITKNSRCKTMGTGSRISRYINAIGNGPAQFINILLAGGVEFADGAEILLLSAVAREVQDEWSLSPVQSGSIVSVVFFGMLIGNLLCSATSDLIGRRPLCLFGYLFLGVFSVLSTFSGGYKTLTSIRFFVGVGIGLSPPASNALVGEICPSRSRMRWTVVVKSLMVLGQVYSAGLCYIYSPELMKLPWRELIIYGSLPCFGLGLFAYVFLLESPHFLAVQGNLDVAKSTLLQIAKMNGSELTNEDILMREESSDSEPEVILWREHLSHFCSGKYLFTTLTLCWTTFTMNFTYYGTIYALPQVLAGARLPFSPAVNMMIASCGEMCGVICGGYYFTYHNRKGSMQVLMGLMALTTMVFVSCIHPSIITEHTDIALIQSIAMGALFLQKMVSMISWLVIYVYMAEVYPTVCRASGPAMCIAFGRWGSITSPMLFEHLLEGTGSYVMYFLLMCCCCIIDIVLIQFLPFETKDVLLTSNFKEAQREKSMSDIYGSLAEGVYRDKSLPA